MKTWRWWEHPQLRDGNGGSLRNARPYARRVARPLAGSAHSRVCKHTRWRPFLTLSGKLSSNGTDIDLAHISIENMNSNEFKT